MILILSRDSWESITEEVGEDLLDSNLFRFYISNREEPGFISAVISGLPVTP